MRKIIANQTRTQPTVLYDPPPGREGYGYALMIPQPAVEVEEWKQVNTQFYAVPLEEPKLDEPERVV